MGKSYLVIGEPGTGKTVFALQFLVNGLMNKEKGLYVAIDEKPADVFRRTDVLAEAALDAPQIVRLGRGLGLARPPATVDAFVAAMRE